MTNAPQGAPDLDEGFGARVLALSARAERVLTANPRTQEAAASLPSADQGPLRIALLGPYSAGKTMLIAALLRLPPDAVEELVDAAPKTHELTEYHWNDATLMDLPGTLSGNDEDSLIARQGVRRADALMIVTTSELPGEAESRAILHALDADGFADRSVVVVNKMNAENSDPDVILDEIRKRLDHFAAHVPIVPTDAKDYVDAINHPDLTDGERDLLIADSGIDSLTSELQRIIAPGADRVRPRAQAVELTRVLGDAERQWELDGEERSAAEFARKLEDAISRAAENVLTVLERESDVVASIINAAGGTIADSASEKDGKIPADVLRDSSRKRERAVTSFDVKFNSSMKAAFDALTSQYGSTVPEPDSWVSDLTSPATTIEGSADDESRLERAARDVAKDGSRLASEWLAKLAADGSKGGMAEKIASRLIKTPVGQKLLDLGGRVSNGAGKFRPHGRLKATSKVVKTAGKAQWALVVIGPAIDLAGVVNDQVKRRKIDKYREGIRSQFQDDATRTRSLLAEAGLKWVGHWILEVEQSLSSLSNRGAEIIAEREAALSEIRILRDEAENLVRVAHEPVAQSTS